MLSVDPPLKTFELVDFHEIIRDAITFNADSEMGYSLAIIFHHDIHIHFNMTTKVSALNQFLLLLAPVLY
jgi:hypothetical protein